MNIRDRRALVSEAENSLANASYDPQKLILIHTGAVLVLSLLLSVVDYLLEHFIGSTGGLGGIGIRSILSTAQSVLRILQAVALPFWQMGYVYLTMRLSRQESVTPSDLLHGFRNFRSVLRLELLRTFLYVGIIVLCSYISSILFFLTPWAASVSDAMLALMENTSLLEDPAALQDALLPVMESAAVPMGILFAIVALVLFLPVLYRYRMASYALLDAPEKGALAALRSSRQMTRKNCIALFRLDLHFWWFYLLEAAVTALCYGDLILNWLGVPLPFDTTVAYFLFLVLSLGCQLGLYLWRKNLVSVSYAHAYHALNDARDLPVPNPEKQPWND